MRVSACRLGVVLLATAAAGLLPASPTSAAGDIHDVGGLVDRVVPDQLTDNDIPGAAVTVVAGGEVVLSEGFGLADVDRHVSVDPERTRFATGSMAKTITANAVLRLVAEGRLDLDEDVNHYLTRFTIDDTFPGHPVRVRDLLTHTAGFEDDVLGKSWDDPAEADSLADIAEDQPERVREPGTLLAYDNYAYTLAGYLVEVVSGQPFAEYVNQNILTPLGMRGTTFAPDPHDDRLATGYRPGSVAYQHYYHPPASGRSPRPPTWAAT